MYNLKKIKLHLFTIQVIPKEIKYLCNLIKLKLYNNIEVIQQGWDDLKGHRAPPEIKFLIHLIKVNLSYNKIKRSSRT